MGEKEKYSWTSIFDGLKSLYPDSGIILVKSRRKFRDPFTPRTIVGMAHMYVSYDYESDSIEIWTFTVQTEYIIDLEDRDWGRGSMKDKMVGRINRNGEWVELLMSVWIAD